MELRSNRNLKAEEEPLLLEDNESDSKESLVSVMKGEDQIRSQSSLSEQQEDDKQMALHEK